MVFWWSRRSRAYLTEQYGDRPATVGGYDMSLPLYLRYSDQAATDDQPLYLFDKHFARSAPKLAADFTVPGACLSASPWLGPPAGVALIARRPSSTACCGAIRS